MNNELHVLIQIVPTTSGTKTIALCGHAEDGSAREDDFEIVTNSFKGTFVALKDKVVELGIPFNKVHILGEFNSEDLSEEEYKVWETPIKDL